MTHKTDVRFPVEGNVELHAWLFFDPYLKEFAASSTAAVNWFRENLGA
jgi:hypothetical protein